MKPDVRAEIVDRLQLAEDEILVTKAKEYANNEDTLANFKVIASVLNVAMPLPEGHQWTPEHVLAVYWLKHILAALDNMDRGETLSEGLESRILDIRVYAACALCLTKDKDK